MKEKKKRAIFIAALAIFVIFLGTACKKTSQEAEEQLLSGSSRILKEVADEYWNFLLEESIYLIVPKEELTLVIPFLNSFIREGTQSQFYVNDNRLEAIESSVKNEFYQDLVQVINSDIKPALENLVEFIKADYQKKAPDAVGLWQYPEGREYYTSIWSG